MTFERLTAYCDNLYYVSSCMSTPPFVRARTRHARAADARFYLAVRQADAAGRVRSAAREVTGADLPRCRARLGAAQWHARWGVRFTVNRHLLGNPGSHCCLIGIGGVYPRVIGGLRYVNAF